MCVSHCLATGLHECHVPKQYEDNLHQREGERAREREREREREVLANLAKKFRVTDTTEFEVITSAARSTGSVIEIDSNNILDEILDQQGQQPREKVV